MRVGIGPLVVAAALVGAAGAIHGVQTDRWGASAALEQAVTRLERVPTATGDWRGADVPYEVADMTRGGIQGCVFRTYRNARTREEVTVLLVCGRGGPISVHTPDVCYAGAGYRQLAEAQKRNIELAPDRRETFWAARFAKPGAVPAQIEIYWAWSQDGRSWEAPENPRWSLARLPALYKLYVVRSFIAGTREEKADSCRDFLHRVLPEWGQALAPSA